MKKLTNRPFLKNVVTLMTGTSLAQALPIAVSPILTRIYSPSEMGLLALYLSLAAMLSVLANLRYELAIVLPEDDKDGASVVVLSMLVAFVISGLIMGVVLIGGDWIAIKLGNPEIEPWLYLLPVSVLVTGWYQAFNYWANRKKKYGRMSTNRVLQTGTSSGVQVGVGYLTQGAPLGLILGNVLGFFVASFRLGLKIFQHERNDFKNLSANNIKRVAVRYQKFPKYLVPAHSLNTASMQLPVVLLTSFFGATSVGFYSLAHRTLRLPMSVIGNAVGDVFREKAARDYNQQGNCTSIYKKTFKSLTLLSIVPFTAFFFVAPMVFGFVFGSEWTVAGEYAQLMTPMLIMQFISNPLSNMYMIAEKQKIDLTMQISLFILTMSSIVIGHLVFDNMKWSVGLFSISYAIIYTIHLINSYHFSKGKDVKHING